MKTDLIATPPTDAHPVEILRAAIRTLLEEITVPPQQFRTRWGQAVLLHLPADANLEEAAFRFRPTAILPERSETSALQQSLQMLRAFRDMVLDFIPLQPGRATIGRGDDAELRVENASVSKRHALLSWMNSEIWLSDLKSRNGTEVNGRLIQAPVRLTDGDLIHVGDSSMVFLTADTLSLQLQSVRHMSQSTR